MLERVAHVLNVGQYNLLLMTQLIRFYPTTAVILPRSGGRSLTFRLPRPENGLLEIEVHRRVTERNMVERSDVALVAARSSRGISWSSAGSLDTPV